MKELKPMMTGILCIDCMKGQLLRLDADNLVCAVCGMEYTIVSENEDGTIETFEYA